MTDNEVLEPEEEEEQAPNPPPHGRIPAEGEEVGEEEEVPSPPPHGRVPAEEPRPEPESGPTTLADLNIYDTLRFMVGILNQAAWMHLGLVVPPGATEAKTDLVQARVAIDSLEALAQQLRPDSDPAEARELDAMLANLRINYVRKAE